MIGSVYGSVFELRGLPDRPELSLVTPQSADTLGVVASEAAAAVAAATAVSDNRDLVDRNASQRLTSEEVAEMKKKGASATEIVDSLAAHSETFTQKTSFAQEKYIRRKTEKHQILVTSLCPCAANIAEATFYKDRAKICNLRPDTLARMLLKAAVAPGTRSLVCETCSGLVYAAVAERLGAQGTVVCVSPSRSAASTRPSHAAHFVRPLATFEMATIKPAAIAFGAAGGLRLVFSADYSDEAGLGVPADSLLVVTRYDPIDLTLALLPHLRLGGSFAVFCSQIRPLEQLAEIVMGTLACDVELTEDWLREFQVKAAATHPEMSMDGAPGYVLSGIRVLPGERELQLANTAFERVRPPSVVSEPVPTVTQAPAPAQASASAPAPVSMETTPDREEVGEEEEPQEKKQKTTASE